MTEIVVSVLVFGCLGCCLGFIIGIAFGYKFGAWQHSKRECRECRRRIIEEGGEECAPVANARHRRAILEFCDVYCMVYPPGDPDVPVVLQGAFLNFCDELGIEQVKLGKSEASHG